MSFAFPNFRAARKLLSIRGGVHPNDQKILSSESAIEQMPLPNLLRIPLQQHIGALAEPVVAKGDIVDKGQLLAVGQGSVSASIHAPTSGLIVAISRFVAPHPSGLPVPTITLRPDREERWTDLPSPLDLEKSTPEEIAKRVASAGIVGMGGATFPSSVKLNLRNRFKLETLIINAAECEPYLTCDDRLLRERSADVADGIAFMARALDINKIIIGIEENKPDAIAAMSKAVEGVLANVQIVAIPTRYPMGSEKHLVQVLTGQETPARGLTADIGIIVHNGATAYAIHKAARFGHPLISRILTVSGRAVKRPANVEVLIGTPIVDIITHCGGLVGTPSRLLLGGPMMGQPIANTRSPVVKGSNGILALSHNETRRDEIMPCIRCGNCVNACPSGLTPLDMNARIRNEELDSAVDIGLLDCVSCGACSYACPSNIPLVQSFNYAKGKLIVQQRTKQRQEETKRLAKQRNDRMERIAAAKREAMARRKAEKAAKLKKHTPEKEIAPPSSSSPLIAAPNKSAEPLEASVEPLITEAAQ
ncbi:MAG: electron transport complex subunit RsxC [Hyphomicrobiaceae bacterium]|nr:electron transport complex subunit RsxC [Hyphomicrobiaceae bacterium]